MLDKIFITAADFSTSIFRKQKTRRKAGLSKKQKTTHPLVRIKKFAKCIIN